MSIGENSTGNQPTIAIYPFHKNFVVKFSLIANTRTRRGRFYGNLHVIHGIENHGASCMRRGETIRVMRDSCVVSCDGRLVLNDY